MFSYEMSFQVSHEQHQDRLRRAAQRRLVRAIRSQASAGRGWPRQAAGWLGLLLVRLGTRLQDYGCPAHAYAGRRVTDAG